METAFNSKPTMRKSSKQSLLPKPRRPVSTDRLSTEARRPSTAGYRSSSADARATFAGRMSRDASVTKAPLAGRPRSQQAQLYMTPLRSSQYSVRATTTPRTPSEDRTRSWQTSLDRALAFVTIKDTRPINNPGWVRMELGRVQEALAARGGGVTLIRPLTIARFIDIVGSLLAVIMASNHAKLNNDNYVAKLPHLSKRLLYPGTVSKSWLKTVNTLHAFPQALALISYLQDMALHIETPPSEEWLYLMKDELSVRRREYLRQCWVRFQEPRNPQFEDINENYFNDLKAILGDNDDKIIALKRNIKNYEDALDDEEERQERAEEARCLSLREQRASALREARAARRDVRANLDRLRAERAERAGRDLDADIRAANAEIQQLKQEVETQPISVQERVTLLENVDFKCRVLDSKRSLVERLTKALQTKDSELALWQKRSLDSCVEFKQALVQRAAHCPSLAALAVDEKDLMSAECVTKVSEAAETLRAHAASMADRRALLARSRSALTRKLGAQLESTRTKISEIESLIEECQRSLEAERGRESASVAEWSAEREALRARVEAALSGREEHDQLCAEKLHWERQEEMWVRRLTELREYIELQEAENKRIYEEECCKRTALLVRTIQQQKAQLEHE